MQVEKMQRKEQKSDFIFLEIQLDQNQLISSFIVNTSRLEPVRSTVVS